MTTIPKGAIVLCSRGAYSDYQAILIGRAIQDLDGDALRERWLMAHPDQRVEYRFEEEDFVAWLVVEGLLEELPFFEYHIASYGITEEMEIREPTAPLAQKANEPE